MGIEYIEFVSVPVKEQHSVPTETLVYVWVALSLSDWDTNVESVIVDDATDDLVGVFSLLKCFNNSNASGFIVTGWCEGMFWRESSIWSGGSGRRRFGLFRRSFVFGIDRRILQ